MIIHQPEMINKDGEILFSTCVEVQSPSLASIEMPERLWFSFPESYQDYISWQSDGFIASLILRAMSLGEDVEVRGETSARLAYGLEEYQAIYRAWLPKQLKKISVTYQKINTSTDQLSPKGVGTAFSGGVDSFHTLSLNSPENQPNMHYQITHGLFVHGFDISLAEGKLYSRFWGHYEILFKNLGISLLRAKTNSRQFYAYQVDWLYTHGGPLIGTVLILGKLFRAFYIPATYVYPKLLPLGTSPLSDHLLSTEGTQIIHHGAIVNRTEKLDYLAQWQPTYENLRVCIYPQKTNTYLNCGKCEKCIPAMVHLDLNDQLKNYTVFPKTSVLLLYLRWFFSMGSEYNFVTQLIKRATTLRKFWLIPLLLLIYVGGFYTDTRVKIKSMIPYKIKYWVRKRLGMIS
ncbi:MAG: hypothetical protein GY755_09510 [Chloroflexi bacterium]|nr:hypothetical protein [Chloroflexota bacterium]